MPRTVRLAAFVFASTVFGNIAAVRPAVAEQASPTVSKCQLETTQRVAFRIESVPKDAVAVALNLHLFDSHKAWLGDELILNGGLDAPILPVSGLLDPARVASVTCSIDGYVGALDQLGIVPIAPAAATGRKQCTERGGLIVDGGPDAYPEAVIIGRTWLMVRLSLSINHFLANHKSDFAGDIFSAAIDHGPNQKVVVSGSDPQSMSFLFTGLQPGMHQVDYGPWFADEASSGAVGYHSLCVRLQWA